MGYANIGITLDTYSHLIPGIQVTAVLRFDEELSETVPANGSVGKTSQKSLSQKSELVTGMSLGVPSKRHQLGRC